MATPAPPPRLSGVPAQDILAVVQYLNDFYRATVLEDYYLTSAEQTETDDFDPSTLPDPASTTVAQAQQTANEAYTLAANANTDAESALELTNEWVQDQITISETATTGAVTFDDEQSDTNYYIVASVAASSGAGLPAESFLIAGITSLATTGFTLNIHTAPGVGNSVTYNWFLRR